MRPYILPALLMLTACGTPQEQCINRETRDLRVVERLIAQTQGNLDRGYGFEEVTIYTTEYVYCTPGPIFPDAEDTPPPERQLCLDEVPETVRRPVALDLAEEQRKLESLTQRRQELLGRAEQVIAACKAAYPEE
jgi:hypothetical protein